jgi:ABC-type multidrug transport system ATPase subunit
VSKAFGSRQILSSASLRAISGQVRAMVGRNGVGKSTLIKIAAGKQQPDSGVVRFRGQTLLKASQPMLARQGVFFLPDHDILSPSFTLAAQLALFEQRFATRGAAAAAALADVTGLLSRFPYTFSGGELRRAELALALVRQPSCMIADEPYRGISPVDQSRVGAILRGMADEGCAVIVTGHEVSALFELADHVTWCVAGTTYELGPPEIARAHETFAREYLGPGRFARTKDGNFRA